MSAWRRHRYNVCSENTELGDQVLDLVAREHPLTRLPPKLGRIVPWHVWLLTRQGQLSQPRSTFRGQGQSRSHEFRLIRIGPPRQVPDQRFVRRSSNPTVNVRPVEPVQPNQN